jgi:murein DD-endopeptidase MepM/ murein hydrolase activator NlpD
MKRIFRRKRKDYRLFAAAVAFGFIAALATVLTTHNPVVTSTATIQQASIQKEQTSTVAFAYASEAANAIFKPIKAPAAAQQQSQPATPNHYLPGASAKAAPSMTEEVQIGKGDTLNEIFSNFSVPQELAISAIDSMKSVFSPRNFRVGQQLTLLFRPTPNGREFRGYRFAADSLRDVIVLDAEGKGDFDATVVKKQLYPVTIAKHGKITGSLVGAASRAGVPYSVVSEMIRVYSYNVDFQRDIHEGDSFEVMYQAKADKAGKVFDGGDMTYARLILDGKEYPIYRYESGGVVDYYKADGSSVRRGLIRTPLDGARITSGFGFRMHPLLGYNKMHKGVDFGAPKGTPIYAAGDGVIAKAGVVNGYGNYIKINHNGRLATAYGHMSRFANGMHSGVRVKQGQVIGYVGMTGRATGPHLHYEVLINGSQVNPVGVKVPTSNQLAGKQLGKFKQFASGRASEFKQALAKTDTGVASR